MIEDPRVDILLLQDPLRLAGRYIVIPDFSAVDVLRGPAERDIDRVDFRAFPDAFLKYLRRALADLDPVDRRSREIFRPVTV